MTVPVTLTRVETMGHLGEAVAGPGGHPLLVDVIVDHDAGAGRRNALLWPLVTKTNNC